MVFAIRVAAYNIVTRVMFLIIYSVRYIGRYGGNEPWQSMPLTFIRHDFPSPNLDSWNHVITIEHDDVIKWKHFPRYWPFVREIHRSPVNFPHKGQWRGALMFTLICARMNGWVNNREAGDLRRYLVHYDVVVMVDPLDSRWRTATDKCQ